MRRALDRSFGWQCWRRVAAPGRFINDIIGCLVIKEFFSNKELLNLKNIKENGVTPIFILGMPRSGTSLIEQIVSNHSEVHGAGELDLLPTSLKNSDWQNSIDFEEVSQKIREEFIEDSFKWPLSDFFPIHLTGPTDGKF